MSHRIRKNQSPDSDHVHRILTIIRQIPSGKVASYGQIARLAGIPRNAREVGSVLRKLPAEAKVPWFRVVNSRGEISARISPDGPNRQHQLLVREGIKFDSRGRISLDEFGWKV